MARAPVAAVQTNFGRLEIESPVPGRPDLKPSWIGESTTDFFEWLRAR